MGRRSTYPSKEEDLWYLIHYTESDEYGTHLKKLCKIRTNKANDCNEIKVNCRSGYYPFEIIKEGLIFIFLLVGRKHEV